MNKIRVSILGAALLLLGMLSAQAQTADEIVQKHIAAIGGQDVWKKLKSIKMIGSLNINGTEIPISVTTVHGKGQRSDISFNGMSGYEIITTTEGWSLSPFGGQSKPEAMTEAEVKQQQDGLDIQGALIDYKAKGNKIDFLGKDNLEGTDVYKLKVTHANGNIETMYFDASSYYHIRSVEKIKVDGKEIEDVTNYSNYKKLPEGIVFPMSIESEGGPMVVKTVEVNKVVDESIFKPTK